MIFHTYGDRNNRAVLLIHTLFTNADFFAPIRDFLATDRFVIVPTLSGHYENSLFISTADEIRQINEFLTENAVTSLETVAGFSLGGNIAYEFFCENRETIDRAVVDSAPLFKLPSFVQKYYYRRYAKCLKKIKAGNCDTAKELNRFFNGMGEYQKDIAPTVSYESLKPLVGSCFHTKIHRLPEHESKKITFIYGSKDPAKLCNARLNHDRIFKMKGYGHCGFYRENPIAWAKKFLYENALPIES